jgi:putative flavoprotein involved in K+ transport
LTTNARLGRRLAAARTGKGTPLVRVRSSDLAQAGVERAPRVVGQADGRPVLEDGRVLDVANVIWCTGYRPDYSWIALPQFPQDELPAHRRGAVLDQPGLYFIGLPFLYRTASSLVGGVGADARHIAHLTALYLARERPRGAAKTGSRRTAAVALPHQPAAAPADEEHRRFRARSE